MGEKKPADLAVLGMGVMGRALALNFASRGFRTAVWNRRPGVVDAVVAEGQGAVVALPDLAAIPTALAVPRVVVLMVTAGPAVDAIIDDLRGVLAPGDIIVDAGNTWFEDTRRREAALAAVGLHFVGLGVSGGEEGARRGPSLMPGGTAAAYTRLKPFFTAIAAESASGACVTHVGPDGAGHFVKMVHNGIEYADMQLIAEAYHVLRDVLGYAPPELAALFAAWGQGPLASYLIDISAKIFRVADPAGDGYLVDHVLDAAAQKGTGRWTVQAAMDLGVPVPAISAAVHARALSARVGLRRAVARAMPPASPSAPGASGVTPDALHDALLGAKITAYAQGLELITAASARYGWDIRRDEVARIWTGGCIIRARLLTAIRDAFGRDPALPHLLLDPVFSAQVLGLLGSLRAVSAAAALAGIPTPAMTAALAYVESLRSEHLPHNLLQAQRDAFGAHTFLRRGAEDRGPVHHAWLTD